MNEKIKASLFIGLGFISLCGMGLAYTAGKHTAGLDYAGRLRDAESKSGAVIAESNQRIADLERELDGANATVASQSAIIASVGEGLAKVAGSYSSRIDLIEEIRYYAGVLSKEVEDWYDSSGGGVGDSSRGTGTAVNTK